ncbi:MAG: hypothetical protein ABII80_02330 [bacterium]
MNLPSLSLIKQAHATGSFNINIGNQVEKRVAITDLNIFISRAISAVILVAAIATFLYLVLGGVQWITSSGEKEKVKEARDKITHAIIGLTIVAAAWAIYLLVDYFFGIGNTA